MAPPEVDAATGAARRFRAAIVTAVSDQWVTYEPLRGFPRAVCGDATRLVGQYLLDSGLGHWNYICGVDDAGQTHAWAELDDWIIDITAAQFAGVDHDVVSTDDATWYARFCPTTSHPWADLSSVDGPAVETLWRHYDRLKTIADGLDP